MQGLEVYGPDGRLVMTTATLVGRYLGYVNSGVADGSISDGRLSTGTPYYFAQAIGNNSDTTILCTPSVYISGSGLSWSFQDFSAGFQGGNAPRVSVNIFYGVL